MFIDKINSLPSERICWQESSMQSMLYIVVSVECAHATILFQRHLLDQRVMSSYKSIVAQVKDSQLAHNLTKRMHRKPDNL